MTQQEELDFRKRVETDLPKMIMVDDKSYKLIVYGLAGNGLTFAISYREHDGNSWVDSDDLFYNHFCIINEIPPTKEYDENELQDGTIYKTNIDDIISYYLDKLKSYQYSELTEIISRQTQFNRELVSLLNRYSKENGSNTPDFLLASYLTDCLHTFNLIVNAREEWYERGEKRKEKDITDESSIKE